MINNVIEDNQQKSQNKLQILMFINMTIEYRGTYLQPSRLSSLIVEIILNF